MSTMQTDPVLEAVRARRAERAAAANSGPTPPPPAAAAGEDPLVAAIRQRRAERAQPATPTPIPPPEPSPYTDAVPVPQPTGILPGPARVPVIDPVMQRVRDMQAAAREAPDIGPPAPPSPPEATGPIAPMQEVQPRTFGQNVSAGFRQTVAGAIPPGIADSLGVQNWQERTGMEKPASGVGGFVGQTGGMVASLPAAFAPKNPLDTAAILAAGPLGKLIGKITGPIASVAGDRVATLVSHQLSGAALMGNYSAVHEAGSIPLEHWQADPVGSLGRVAHAAGSGALAGAGVGSVTGGVEALGHRAPETVQPAQNPQTSPSTPPIDPAAQAQAPTTPPTAPAPQVDSGPVQPPPTPQPQPTTVVAPPEAAPQPVQAPAAVVPPGTAPTTDGTIDLSGRTMLRGNAAPGAKSRGAGMGNGLYLTEHENLAKAYDQGGGVARFAVDPSAKILDSRSPEYDQLFRQSYGPAGSDSAELARLAHANGYHGIAQVTTGGKVAQVVLFDPSKAAPVTPAAPAVDWSAAPWGAVRVEAVKRGLWDSGAWQGQADLRRMLAEQDAKEPNSGQPQAPTPQAPPEGPAAQAQAPAQAEAPAGGGEPVPQDLAGLKYPELQARARAAGINPKQKAGALREALAAAKPSPVPAENANGPAPVGDNLGDAVRPVPPLNDALPAGAEPRPVGPEVGIEGNGNAPEGRGGVGQQPGIDGGGVPVREHRPEPGDVGGVASNVPESVVGQSAPPPKSTPVKKMTLAQLRAEIEASVELEGAGKMGRKDLEQAVEDLRANPPDASPPEQPAQPAANAPGAGGKEPWQQDKGEYFTAQQNALIERLTAEGRPIKAERAMLGGKHLGDLPDQWNAQHRAAVKQALAANRPVPPEVLADYPDLAGKAPDKSAGEAEPSAEPSPLASDISKEAIPLGSDGVDRYGIYRVNVAGEGERFAVRTSDNARGFGDTIHQTPEAARKYAAETKERDQKNAEFKAKRDAEQAERDSKAASEKADRENMDGFGTSMTPFQRGRAVAVLNGLVRIGGKVARVKDHVREMVRAGNVELTTREESAVAPMNRSAFNRADQRAQDAHAKKMLEGGTKTRYLVNGHDMGKMAYEYAKHLQDNPPVQSPPVTTPQGAGRTTPPENTPERPGGTETIADAAYRAADGKVLVGRDHADALDRAGIDPYDEDAISSMTEGFVTSSGRFVDRAEAAKIAKAANQADTARLYAHNLGRSEDPFDRRENQPQPAPAKSGGEGAAPAAEPTPSRLDRARDVVQRGRRSPHADEFGGVKGAKKAVEEEGKAAEPPSSPSFPTAEEIVARKGPEKIKEMEAKLAQTIEESQAMAKGRDKGASDIIATERIKGNDWDYRVGRAKNAEGKSGYWVEMKMRDGSSWERADRAPWRPTAEAARKQWATGKDFTSGETEWTMHHPELKASFEAAKERDAKMAADREAERVKADEEHRRAQEVRASVESAVQAAKWKRGEFKTSGNPAAPDGKPETKSATIYAGLAIHKEGPGHYVVSHAASGKSITHKGFDSLAKAKAFVLRVSKLTDWTKPEADVLKAVGSSTYGNIVRPLVQDPYRADIQLGVPEPVAAKAEAPPTPAPAEKPKPMNMAGQTRPERPKPAERPPLPQKSIDLINKAIDEKDLGTLLDKGGLHPGNKGWRSIFTERTGVDLPSTVGGTDAAVREWAKGAPAEAAKPPTPSAPVDPVTGTINRLLAAKKPAPLSLRNLMAETGENRGTVIRKAAEMAAEGKITPEQMDPTLRASVAKYREGKPGPDGPSFAMGASTPDVEESGFHEHAVTMAKHGVEAPEGIPTSVRERLRRAGDTAKEAIRYIAGTSYPTTTAANRPAGEAMARWAASPDALQARIRTETTKVLGGLRPDSDAIKIAGVVLNEDNARGTVDELRNRAAKAERDGEPEKAQELLAKADAAKSFVGKGGFWATEEDYQRDAAKPAVRGVIKRFKNHINPLMDEYYKKAKGLDQDAELPTRGRDFGCRVNRLAVMEGEEPRAFAKETSRPVSGNLERAKAGATAFSKEATGAGDSYNTSIEDMTAASIKGNWEKARKLDAYKSLVKAGLAKFADSKAPVRIGDRPAEAFKIDEAMRNNAPAKVIHVRSDIAPEFRRALDADKRTTVEPFTSLTKVPNALMLASPSEPIAHITNLLGALARRPYRGGTVLGKMGEVLARSGIPGGKFAVNLADAASRIPSVVRDDPRVQENLARMANIGATKGAGTIERTKNAAKWGKVAIDVADRAVRLTLQATADEYERRLGRPLTETERREFINAPGQYNRRMQGEFVRFMRDSGVGPFATAVKQGYVHTKEVLTLDPKLPAKSTGDAVRLRAEQALGILVAPVAISAAWNTMVAGTPFPKGIPVGAVATHKNPDGSWNFWDGVWRLSGLRRAGNTTGLSAAATALNEGRGVEQAGKEAVRQAGNSVMSFLGPAPRMASIAVTGREPGFGLPRASEVSPQGPGSFGQAGLNLKAAAVKSNPFVAKIAAPEEGRMLGGLGVSKGKSPAQVESLPGRIQHAETGEYADDVIRRIKKQYPLSGTMPQAEQAKAADARIKALQAADDALPVDRRGQVYNRKNARRVMYDD